MHFIRCTVSGLVLIKLLHAIYGNYTVYTVSKTTLEAKTHFSGYKITVNYIIISEIKRNNDTDVPNNNTIF